MITTVIISVAVAFFVERMYRIVVTMILDYMEDKEFKKKMAEHEEYKRNHPECDKELIRFARDPRRFIV